MEKNENVCHKHECNHECNHKKCCEKHNHEHNCQHANLLRCPICGKIGIEVPIETVKSLTQDNTLKSKFYLCTSKNCNTVYYNEENIYSKQDVVTKIWYKGNIEDFIVCYCHNIKLLDIIESVNILEGDTNKEAILKLLNKDISKKRCLYKNPTGTNCDRLFDNAIEFAYEIYIKNRKGE